jgi:dsRNA-specific ribonuclease
LKSPKSRLQELTQRSAHERPVYGIVEATGPDHLRRFVVEVRIDGQVRGVGEGPSRRAAETAAAREAVEALEGGERRPRARRRLVTSDGGRVVTPSGGPGSGSST